MATGVDRVRLAQAMHAMRILVRVAMADFQNRARQLAPDRPALRAILERLVNRASRRRAYIVSF